MTRLVVNGERTDVPARTTVAALVDRLRPDRRGVAVAVDGAVAPRSEWEQHVLVEGAQVEILVASRGG